MSTIVESNKQEIEVLEASEVSQVSGGVVNGEIAASFLTAPSALTHVKRIA